jgi:nucleoside 2-deoxyribosyltransferase
LKGENNKSEEGDEVNVKIYFACSITGGRQDEKMYQKLVGVLLEMGIEVPTAHIAETGIEEMDAKEDARDIYQRDVNWIQESDSMIAEVSTPSHGVGYEIGFALTQDKPVLCLHDRSVKVSKMITGNTHPLLKIASYQDFMEAARIIKRFLADNGHS